MDLLESIVRNQSVKGLVHSARVVRWAIYALCGIVGKHYLIVQFLIYLYLSNRLSLLSVKVISVKA